MKIIENEGMSALALIWLLKRVEKSMRDNYLYRNDLDGFLQNIVALLTSKSGSPKKLCTIEYENCRNGGYARFGPRLSLNIRRTCCEGKPAALPSFWRMLQKISAFLTSQSGSPKKVWYSTQKSSKRGVFTFGVVWPRNLVGLVMRDNRLNS